MAQLQHTAIGEIPVIRETLYHTFRAGKTRPLEWRRQQLYQLARMAQENSDAFVEAIGKDLGKPPMETWVGEVGGLIDRCLQCATSLEDWSKPEVIDVPDWQKPWQPTIYKAPKGVVLIIAPWNYPMILSLQPLYGAISAGCCAVVKPSEVSPAYSQLLADLMPKYLDGDAYRVVNGGVEETTELLKYPWDHIFYTGNGRVARIIATAAAKHLTPCSFELGGKSPVIIDSEYDVKLAAKRVLFGKCTNAGQICVAPDYVLIPADRQDEFIAALKEHHESFFPEGPLKSPSYGRIVNGMHHARLTGLLKRTQGKIVLGGQVDDKNGLAPTIVKDVKEGDSLLEGELFGPILPIVPVKDLAEAITYVSERDHPLVLYAFTENPQVKQQLLDNTRSGNIVFNDTFQQLAVNELPFSGVGESGYGYQVMKYSYEGFTHARGSIDMPKEAEPHLEGRYAPYTDDKFKAIQAILHRTIPN
ncbi:hypothetical protein JAAARDRAFT_77074 [Jaapia argillacea MUCL 33604]|uniref:Aldehyde dehydrogenase n=1 Tax=Jaapia argillacea MUCL 33604 TaxID=933084 RepID=A0A067Q4A2_9AGAM|nr:hypothetical protein JAAARDRAFT_77074 [Jaapia argillacea MUCL 33604]